jgi:hypothetical protein
LLIFLSDDEEDEEEDETAELLRELEKIKRERAEEQARKVGTGMLSVISLIHPDSRTAKQMLQTPPFVKRKSQQPTP